MKLLSTTIAETVADNVLRSLDIMWRGVLAIFLVIAILICAVLILNYATLPAAEKAARRDARAQRKAKRKTARAQKRAEKQAARAEQQTADTERDPNKPA